MRGGLDGLGREMSRLPVHPRLAHMLLAAGATSKRCRLAAQLAALLSERDFMRAGAIALQRDPDIRTRLEVMRGEISSDRIRSRAARGRVSGAARALPGAMSAPAVEPDSDRRCPARCWRSRIRTASASDGEGQGRYLLANGRGARVCRRLPRWRGRNSSSRVELDDRGA